MKREDIIKILGEDADKDKVTALLDAMHAEIKTHKDAADTAKAELATKVTELAEATKNAGSLEAVQTSPDAQGRVLLLVDVRTDFLETVTERVNITIPRYALASIDKRAKAQGLSRSAYMVRSSLTSQT